MTVIPQLERDLVDLHGVAPAPDVDLFPRRPWLRACERVLRLMPNEALDYGDHRGRIELRRALSVPERVRGMISLRSLTL